jgi:hypothetical protein
MEPNGTLTCAQDPASGSCREPDESIPRSPIYAQAFLLGSFLLIFLSKLCTKFFFLPCVLHALYIHSS